MNHFSSSSSIGALVLSMALVALLIPRSDGIAPLLALPILILWICAAACSIVNPHRGLHDRIADTWVVRR